mmetsp:Transcript_16496/g.33703  ORF Transcript_16496/g.33703 Transcript_16496/m.33703 type:complete len:209 (+) Transcript_16496:71-697(+)
MTQRRAILKGGKQSSSPGGTKTIDLRFGMANDSEQDEQASMLDDMLAAAEEEDDSRRFEDDHGMDSPPKSRVSPSAAGKGRVMDQKPSELAAKYGVDVTTEDSDDDDDDFGPDSPVKAPPAVAATAAGGGGADFDFGPMAAIANENSELKHELDERRTQVRKLGVMLEALAPVPGLDAERLLDALEKGGQDIEADPRDVKIVHLAKKV